MIATRLFVAGGLRKAAGTRCPGKRRNLPDADKIEQACAIPVKSAG